MWVEFQCSECERRNRFDLAGFDPAGEAEVDGRTPFEADCGGCETPYRVFVNPSLGEKVEIGDDEEMAHLVYTFTDEDAVLEAWKAELQRARKRTKRQRNVEGRELEEALLAYEAPAGGPRSYAAMQRDGVRLIMLFGVEIETLKKGLRAHTATA